MTCIASINKNQREELLISLEQFHGVWLVNARVWYLKDDTMQPGKQGLALRVELLPQLQKAITDALDLARHEGLIEAADG